MTGCLDHLDYYQTVITHEAYLTCIRSTPAVRGSVCVCVWGGGGGGGGAGEGSTLSSNGNLK